MGAYKFLAGLPAILGVAGFFAYLWAGQSRVGGEILKKIVDKLRNDPNLDIAKYGALTPSKLRDLVRSDKHVRSAVNEGDRDLLRLLIIFQYALTGLVLVVCATLIGVSVWLYSRPEPFSIVHSGPQAILPAAEGLLVDLDPLKVEWTSSGKEETVSVFLENVDSQRRSGKKTVSSSVRSVRFDPADVLAVATDRTNRGKNRVRTVIEWPGVTQRVPSRRTSRSASRSTCCSTASS